MNRRTQFVHADILCARIVHRLKVPIKGCSVIIENEDHAAEDPACGITHRNGNYFVADIRHNGKIGLPEQNIRRDHNDHRCPGIASTPKRRGIDLRKAGKQIKGCNIAQKQRAIPD